MSSSNSAVSLKKSAVDEPVTRSKKRSKKETMSDGSTTLARDGEPSKSESKTRRRKRDTPADNAETVLASNKGDKGSKKSKKRRHTESLSVDKNAITSPDVMAEEQSPKKKRKGETKIIDPAQDESLPEQALKGLSYAFSQFYNPAEWKFNKARQNWLIRNIWSPAMIPDEHMPLLLWYLKNMKGGARDALIKTCQNHFEPLDQPKDESTSPGQTEAETTTTSLFGLSAEVLTRPPDKAQEMKRSRAMTILETLEVQ